MDKQFEKNVCYNFFSKNFKERFWFELTNEKKRNRFLNKIAHTSEDYLLNKCILKMFIKPVLKSDIKKYLIDEYCYTICSDIEFDGKFSNIDSILNKIWSLGPYIIINKDCTKAYLETEYDFKEHKSFFLTVNIK